MSQQDFQQLPARQIPFPTSVSEQARRMLAAMARVPAVAAPAIDDAAAWQERIARSNASILAMLGPRIERARATVTSEAISVSGVPCFRIEPKAPTSAKIMLDFHGGGFTSGAGTVCEAFGAMAAADYGVRVYTVDYRMPPAHPYPAALDDCYSVYFALLSHYGPDAIVVRGVSAGGNLAAATMLRSRDTGAAFPAGVMLLTPELDLTESGDSFGTNADVDVVLKGSLMSANLLYAGGHDLKSPLLSPLFADFAPGFPSTLLTAGTRDLFLSNAARMHNALRRSGNHSELIIEEAMPHGGFLGAPEDDAQLRDTIDFARRAWQGSLRR